MNDFPKRKPLRLNIHDYNTPGAYFITICTHDRKQILSRIVGNQIGEDPLRETSDAPVPILTERGKIVENVLNRLPQKIDISVERFVIMPNHIHMILVVAEGQNAPVAGKSIIAKAVGYLKMNSSKEIRRQFGDEVLWQRGYYDHIIRDVKDHEEIVRYINTNPAKWQFDHLFAEGL